MALILPGAEQPRQRGDIRRNPRASSLVSSLAAELKKAECRRCAVARRVVPTIENQVQALRQIAERRGWQVVEQYSDAGISGSKGRDGRPGLDQMLKDAQRRHFDVVMAWAIDRLGRSLIDLLGAIQTLEA